MTQSVQIERSKAPLVRKMIRERLDGTFAELSEELGSVRWRAKDSERTGDVLIGITAFSFEGGGEES
jgi:hypothetical protein